MFLLKTIPRQYLHSAKYLQPQKQLKYFCNKGTELDLIFSRKLKDPEKEPAKQKKQDPSKTFTDFERKVKATNIKVLKREIFNDSMQLPIKYCAYLLCGHGSSGTFFAELIRSSIDAFNHFLLCITNYLDLKPTSKYPYGLENIKYIVVLIPSCLFLTFGMQTIYSAFHEILYPIQNSAEGTSDNSSDLYSIGLYVASFIIEIGVISLNIRDSIKMSNLHNQKDTKMSTFQLLKSLVSQRDPLLQAILYENAITLISMSVPLFVGISNMLYPTRIYEFLGQNIIGSIQLLLGYRLGKETIQNLLGQTIEEEIKQDVVKEINKNSYVKNVKEVKGMMIGSFRFNFFCVVEYDIERLNEDIMDNYKYSSNYIVYSSDFKERQQELDVLMEGFPLRLLKEVKQQEDNIIKSIQQKFPQCVHFDINMDSAQLFKVLTQEEKIKNSFQLKNNSAEDEQTKSWILKQTDIFIKQRFPSQCINFGQDLELMYDSYLTNPKHYSNEISQYFVEEKALLNENKRKKIIQDEINNNSLYNFY